MNRISFGFIKLSIFQFSLGEQVKMLCLPSLINEKIRPGFDLGSI
jgi:hypothetical protein